jgi:uncharacterized protein
MTLLDFSTESAVFFAVSLVAAAINSVAGGGTFLTFPVFIMGGLTALQANVMSTIALWPGVLASAYGYRSEMAEDSRKYRPLLVIAMLGGVIGAVMLLHTPEVVFKQQVPWLLLSATLIFTFGKRIPVGKHRTSGAIPYVLQLIIAIYGGYFGAGIGILTLAMLQMMGHTHIHKMNALKTLFTGAINVMTVVVFIFSDKVVWHLAPVMIFGALCGGYLGARMALKISPHYVRAMVSIIAFSMTAYFFIYGV